MWIGGRWIARPIRFKDELEIFASSGPIVRSLILAGNGLAPDEKEDVKRILLAMHEDPAAAETLRVYYGVTRYDEIDAEIANSLRALDVLRAYIGDMVGDTLHVAAPIHIGTNFLGGVRIGFDLAGIRADTAIEGLGLADIIAEGETKLVLAAGVATVVLAAVGTGLGILFARQISGPIEHLARVTRLIGRGQYDVRVPFRRTDEIGELANALQDMAAARKQAEEALRLAKDEAEAGSRAKSDFLSSMSHELRTPLNAIVGFAQLLEIDHRTPLTYTRKSYVGHIVESGAHLLELINEVLELDRIEAGKLALAIEDVTVRLVVDDCLVLLEALARRHGVVIVDRSAGRSLPPVRADLVRFKQVLVNLLSNAVKYNHEGGASSSTARTVPIRWYASASRIPGSAFPKSAAPRFSSASAVWARARCRSRARGSASPSASSS
jgi:signal transduction histidine kinase